MTPAPAPAPLFLLFLLLQLPPPGRSEPERCVSMQHRNATVDARAALAVPGAAVNARSLPFERDCVLACCSQPVRPGARCDAAAFDGDKRGGDDNCFLYRCPGGRGCPLAEAPPPVSAYYVFRDAIHPSALRPVAATTGFAAARVPVGTTMTTAPGGTGKKRTKSHPANERAGPRTADKGPASVPPPTPRTTRLPQTAAVTPPPATGTLGPVTATLKSAVPLATETPLAPTTATPPTTTRSPPPTSATPNTTDVTPPPPTLTPPTTAAAPLPSAVTTTPTQAAPLTSNVLLGHRADAAQNASVEMASGAGPWKSGAVAFLVAGVATLLLALAVGGRKAMDSFDRRHYTRLELHDLHYDL
ncbi:MANSC domain-containing protein 1 [Syngnathoides biaculeatus]|uniref:MANSC domain-containing protein 1 n=1 Tax=Syngnathoides biaculeatus TaxID=300417 RepID=UPI002ADDA767|nr:MANSC domain-containing protein 1 [Syngnathoides biaculeatus]